MKNNACLVAFSLLMTLLFQVQGIIACACSDNADVTSSASYVTTAEYCEYLNEQASPEDPNGLFDEKMGGTSQTPALIIRSVTSGRYTYSVALGQEAAPICFVSDQSQKLFLQWLGNKVSSSGSQNAKAPTVRAQSLHCGCGSLHNCNACPLIWKKCPCGS